MSDILKRIQRAVRSGNFRFTYKAQIELYADDLDVANRFRAARLLTSLGDLAGAQHLACPDGRARLCLSWFYYTAPPVLGWAARERAVSFPGRFEAMRAFTRVANLVTPPLLFNVARAIRSRTSRTQRSRADLPLDWPNRPG